MNQLFLPMDLEEDIPHNHLVRYIRHCLSRWWTIQLSSKDVNESHYYAYTQRIYSSRQIAKAVRENVMFMWKSIIGYSLHQRPTDSRCLKPHLEKVKASLGKLPKTVMQTQDMAGKKTMWT